MIIEVVEPSEGTCLDRRYRLSERIGMGGMGQVWAATHLHTGRRVALKLIHTDRKLTSRMKERFFREARAANRARHPSVVEVLDAFEGEDGEPVIVMELLAGETLADLIAREGRLTVPHMAAVLRQVVAALRAAHGSGVIHRDLKPRNVFICDGRGDDSQSRVKVLDFGIAKLVAPPRRIEAVTGTTTTGHIIGTPQYMAPEQLRTTAVVDHRADLWALGVMIYESLSGCRPLEGETVAELVESFLTDGVPPLRELAPTAPLPIAMIARQLLERDPAAGPTLDEVDAVLGLLEDSPAVADDAPTTVATDERGPAKSRRVSASATVIVVSGVAIGLALSSEQAYFLAAAPNAAVNLTAQRRVAHSRPTESARETREQERSDLEADRSQPSQPAHRATAVPPLRPSHCQDHRTAFELDSNGRWALKRECVPP